MTDEMTARALQASWRAAEQSLYAIGGGVEHYQQAIALVRAVSNLLADVESSEELLARWPESAELVARETSSGRQAVHLFEQASREARAES